MPAGFGGGGGHCSWGRWRAPWEAYCHHGLGPNPDSWEGWGWGANSTSWPPWSYAPSAHGSWHHRSSGYGRDYGHHHGIPHRRWHGWSFAAITAVASGIALGLWQIIVRGVSWPALGTSPRREEETDGGNSEEGIGESQSGSSANSWRLLHGQANEVQRDSSGSGNPNQIHENQREPSTPWRQRHGSTKETQRDPPRHQKCCRRNQKEKAPQEASFPTTCQDHPEEPTSRPRVSPGDIWRVCGPDSWVTEVDVWPYAEDEVEVLVKEDGSLEVRCSHFHGGTQVSSTTKALPRPPCGTFTISTTAQGHYSVSDGRLVLTVVSRTKEHKNETQ